MFKGAVISFTVFVATAPPIQNISIASISYTCCWHLVFIIYSNLDMLIDIDIYVSRVEISIFVIKIEQNRKSETDNLESAKFYIFWLFCLSFT